MPDNSPMIPFSDSFVQDVRQLIDNAKRRVARAVNAEISILYWQVGNRINKEVLQGSRAEYGKQVFSELATQLIKVYGRGWGISQLRHCSSFAEIFDDKKILYTLCTELSWSHFRALIFLKDPLQRDFYIEMCRLERWSVRQLKERMDSMLYERTALTEKPEEAIAHDIAKLRDEQAVSPALLLKDPYILDFLNLNDRYLEKDLEDAILREMEQFLLEMGAGFTFVARQKRLQIDDDDFYLDLLFYNRKLKRLVAMELKLGKFKHQHKSQMELYLRWLSKYEQEEDELPPIGIILCADKKEEQIELLEMDKSGIHVAQYLTKLPAKEVLAAKLHESIVNARKQFGSPMEEGTEAGLRDLPKE